MKKCLFLCLLVIILSSSHRTCAQHIIVLRNHENDMAISSYADVYTGQASLYVIDSLLHCDSTQFIHNTDFHEVNYGSGQPRAWCRFIIHNESDCKDWILKIQQSRVDTALLYIVRENKKVERLPMTGHFQNLSERLVHSLPFAYPITIDKDVTVTCYLYTVRQYGRHAAILNIQSKEYFESYEYGFNIVLGFVSGMVALAALVAFFLFMFVRQRLYIYYSLYALSFLFVLLADTGFSHAMLFFPFNQTVANSFTMIFYYAIGGCLGVFTIELLQLKKRGKHWQYRFGKILSLTLGGIALLLLVPALPPIVRWSLTSVSYYVAMLTNVYILYVLSISFNLLKKDSIILFYMVGFYFTSMVAVWLVLADFQIVTFPYQNKDIFYLTPLVEILCIALGIGIHFSRTVKERIHVQRALNRAQEQIITIQEDERKRIAQDLHDDVGNSLAAVRNMVIRKHDPQNIEKEIDNIIYSLRSISHDLMPVSFDEFSLTDIIAHTVNKFKDHPTLSLEFNSIGKPIKMRSLTELMIYRIINELITNIFKHSHASKAFIQLVYQEKSLVVTVEDNGHGIHQSQIEEGIGLRSIRLRAEYIRATFNMESDDKGTLTILEAPYEENI